MEIHQRTIKKRKKEPIARPYTKEAADAILKLYTKEYDEEKELGFDPKNRQSLVDFKFDFTPLGDSVVVKRFMTSNIVLGSDDTGNVGKWIVVMVGPEVTRPIVVGDVVMLGGPLSGDVPIKPLIVNGIKLTLVSAFDIGGIYITKDEYYERYMESEETEDGVVITKTTKDGNN